ncbi:MAG TPA: branched-chain amino acid transaminase [Flavitalea sp.]|nr:branched-chain amino acid transaminase [Flavitalea sp.]
MQYYDASTIIYYDGKFVHATEAKTDLYSQSLHYGIAVFEGIRAYNTVSGQAKIFKAAAHFNRLQRSSELVHIPYEYSNEQLIEVSYELLDRNGLQDAYIRPLIFCGPNMGLGKTSEAHIMICVWQWPALLGEKLIRVVTSPYERPNPKGFLMEAKVSGHYVNSILAGQDARDRGYDEALLLDLNGNVAEGPGANVFFEKDGKLFTPPLGNILPGITRATVLHICKERNIEVEERFFKPEEMKGADAAFFCGTAAEVVGWESYDDIPFAKSWKTTSSKIIQEAYKSLVIEKQKDYSTVLA